MSLVDRRIFQAAVSLMEQYTLQAEAYATSRPTRQPTKAIPRKR
jgi:hypothetical protein